jgi:hypothetical protein
MWIVRVALDRPYTFIVLALMILIMALPKLSELDRPSNDGRLP